MIAVLLAALVSAPTMAERLAIRTFSSADGLASSFVECILQDSSGHLWFATRDGLNRWNGYDFATLDAAGLPGSAIARVYQTKSGEYFVVSNDGAVYSYRPNRGSATDRSGRIVFRRHEVRFNGRDVMFNCLYEDSKGVVWGGGYGVLVKGVGSTNTPIPLNPPAPPDLPFVIVRTLVEGRDGSIWVGTNRGLTRVLPAGALLHYALGPREALDQVSALALDSEGRVWIGHRWLGIVVLNPGRAAVSASSQRLMARPVSGQSIALDLKAGEAAVLGEANGLPTNAVTCLLTSSGGHMWIGTDKGLARFDGHSFARFTKEHGLCDDTIHSLHEGGDASLWVSTPVCAMRLMLEGLSGYTTSDGLATDRVVAFGETPETGLYAIGFEWSINTFDGRRFRASRLPVPAGSTSMWAAQPGYRDRKGRWWGLTAQGLYRFDGFVPWRTPSAAKPDRYYTVRDGLPASSVFRLHEDREGTIWVGTRSQDPAEAGLARFDPALNRAASFPQASLPALPAPSAFAEDRDGNLWIGFYHGGLARFRDGRFRVFGREDGVPEGMVTALVVDRLGRLWISTNLGGVARVDHPPANSLAVRGYSTRNGLASNNVRAIVEDRYGRIYAGSARGVDRLDPDTGFVRHYGAEDGLVSDFVTAGFSDSRGELWFGTFGGVFRLVPRLEREEESPPIVITSVRISGEHLPVMELGETSIGRVVLQPDQRDVEIDFVSVSRRRTTGVSYQYSLAGPAGPWSPPTRARSVNLARLSPGHYVFAVQAVTAGGLASAVPATFPFAIRPPIVQRWWFISLAVALLAALLVGAYRYRVARLLEVQRLRLTIASDLHDEVASNLSGIATLSTALRIQITEGTPTLDRITALATESVDAIREIIWSIDPRPETIGGLLVRLRDTMISSCRARGLHLTMSIPSDGLEQNLTPDQRKNVWLMLKEAVNNAATHSGGTRLAVTLVRAGDRVRITVQDDGREPIRADVSAGRGLGTMKTRAEALGGTMTVRAAPGEGTTVEFLIPLAK